MCSDGQKVEANNDHLGGEGCRFTHSQDHSNAVSWMDAQDMYAIHPESSTALLLSLLCFTSDDPESLCCFCTYVVRLM